MNNLSGGRQCESNVPASNGECNLLKSQSAKPAKQAKPARRRYSGVQRGDGTGPHSAVIEWRFEQRQLLPHPREIDWARIDTSPVESADHAVSVFSSSREDCSSFFVVAKYITDGLLQCRNVVVPNACVWRSTILDQAYLHKACTESYEHVALKLLSAGWLRSIGAERAATEVPCGCGRADAYSADLDLAVECGDTAPSRVLAVLYGNPAAILVIPFGRFDGDSYRGVIFTATKRDSIT